jgi:hypothetical protein
LAKLTFSTPAPRRIGLIINLRSHVNKSHPIDLAAVQARHPDLRVAAPADLGALRDTLAGFAEEGIDLLVVSGGDGTVRDVLSAFPPAYAAQPPELAILSAGNTNLAARVLGSAGSGDAALDRLLRAAHAGRLHRKTCPVLEVSWPDEPGRPPLVGFLFGAAGFTEAKTVANLVVRRRGFSHGLEVAATLFVTALRALVGRNSPIRQGWSMSLAVEGRPAIAGKRFLVMATTLDSLMLGLWPFWGRGSGGIRWLDIDAPPRRFAAGLLAVMLRRPRPWMIRSGYRSGRGNAIRMMFDQPFILDGEAFEARAGVLLSTAGSVTVVAP